MPNTRIVSYEKGVVNEAVAGVSLLCLFVMIQREPFSLYLLSFRSVDGSVLALLGSKEAESILMGSEHLLRKVTATSLARADPQHNVRRLSGNGAFQLAWSPAPRRLKAPHYQLRNRAPRLRLFPSCGYRRWDTRPSSLGLMIAISLSGASTVA